MSPGQQCRDPAFYLQTANNTFTLLHVTVNLKTGKNYWNIVEALRHAMFSNGIICFVYFFVNLVRPSDDTLFVVRLIVTELCMTFFVIRYRNKILHLPLVYYTFVGSYCKMWIFMLLVCSFFCIGIFCSIYLNLNLKLALTLTNGWFKGVSH